MKFRTVHVLVAVTAVASIGGVVWYQQQRDADSVETREQSDSAEEDTEDALARYRLNRELDKLRRDVRDLQNRGATDRGTKTQVEPAEVETADEPPDEPVAARTEEQVDLSLGALHGAEAPDPEWSVDTEESIHTLFSEGKFPGATLVEADCRNTICRVVVSNEDEASFETFRETMPQTPPFDTQGFVRNTGTESRPELVIYFARQGERLDDLLARS